MKIENQVCTLKQAKRLKELGIQQVGYFSHQHYPENTYRIEAQEVINPMQKEGITDPGEWYSAFTVSELGQMLYSETGTQRKGSEDSEYANWEWIDDNNQLGMGMFATEAESRADMLITLIEKKLVDIKDCNERLVA